MAVQAAPEKGAEYAFSGQDFRQTLGAFATGVTVVTTRGAEEAYGMTATAFSSVSLDPPLVLVCVIDGTFGSETIQRNGIFAVNVLGAEQEGPAARPGRVRGDLPPARRHRLPDHRRGGSVSRLPPRGQSPGG
jgi:flavin reductase (DIM6/NTAB) family NADH-FMN oxidoreductase RutF